MSYTKIRVEFEEWAVSKGVSIMSCGATNQPSPVYMCVETEAMWLAWQASRSAVVIELPSADEFDVPSFAHDAIVGCWNAIEAAGLKVAP